jgi:hypothetical protein
MSIFKKRGKGRLSSDITNEDFYKFYLKSVPMIESLGGGMTRGSYQITQTEYIKILEDINKEITRVIITENYEYKLPCSLGRISMKQKPLEYLLDDKGDLKTMKLSVDYKALRELWSNDEEARNNKTLVFHTNDHTNGNRMSWFWSKKGTKCVGLFPYYFIPCRQMKRSLPKILKEENLKLSFFERPLKREQINTNIYNNLNNVKR